MIALILLAQLALLAPLQAGALNKADSIVADGTAAGLVKGSLGVQRGSQPTLWIPAGELLEFEVELDLGLLGDSKVGAVTMSSGVEPFVAGLPLPGQAPPTGKQRVGWVKYTAKAKALSLKINNTLTTRFLPTQWPHVIHSEVQTGRKNRVREIKLGLRDDHWASEYVGDEHCSGCQRQEHFVKGSMPWSDDHHCEGCNRPEHRVPSAPLVRSVPEQTLDILGTVYLARNLIRSKQTWLKTMMVKKNQLWEMTFSTGKTKNINVGAGTFTCRGVLLSVKVPAGEDPNGKKFSGLFGIKGVLTIWMDEGTGVPVMIEGDVPAGSLVDLHAKIGLRKYSGTPEAFRPLP